jgi:hypothetical protein
LSSDAVKRRKSGGMPPSEKTPGCSQLLDVNMESFLSNKKKRNTMRGVHSQQEKVSSLKML